VSAVYRSRWAELLTEAVTRPGLILEAYSWFHEYSVGNQVAALLQCRSRRIDPGPIATFRRWQERGRRVKRSEKAIELCMPVTVARKPDSDDPEEPEEIRRRTIFLWKPHWFVLSQTEGADYQPEACPEWSKERALAGLGVEEVPFTLTDGNAQGYTIGGKVAINPLAKLPWKTLFHELGHALLHSSSSVSSHAAEPPRSLREVEAEAVALLCCDALRLEGADYCRGYIQEWLGKANPIPESSAARVLKAADGILRVGRPINSPASTTP